MKSWPPLSVSGRLFDLWDLFFGPQEVSGPSEAAMIDLGNRLQLVAIICAYICPAVVIAVVSPTARGPVALWLLLISIYLPAYYAVKRYRARSFTPIAQPLGAVLALFGLQMALLRLGSGQDGETPVGLWVAYLAPLILVGKSGVRRYSFWTALAIIAALLTVRLITILYTLPFPLHAITDFIAHPHTFVIYGQIVFICLIGFAVFIIVREMQAYQSRIRVERELVSLLTSHTTFSAAYEAAAQNLLSIGQPDTPYSFVLLYDDQTDRLKVVGSAGVGLEGWQEIELSPDQGITGLAARSRKLVYAADVLRPEWSDKFFRARGLERVRSELAMPIIYEAEDRLIGVLDVESPKPRAYPRNERAKMETWANALALSHKHFDIVDRRVANVQSMYENVMEIGHKWGPSRSDGHVRYLSWFYQVADCACDYFRADLAAFIRLGIGTAYPIFPILIWPGTGFPSLKRNFNSRRDIPTDSLIWKLLDEWRVTAWSGVQDWKAWEDHDQWLREELRATGISTLVFLPIGSIENPVAMMFLGYRRPEVITDVSRLTFQGLATAVEQSYRAFAPTTLEPQRTGIRVHQSIVPQMQAMFAKIHQGRELASGLDQGTPVSPAAEVDQIFDEIDQGLRLLREQVKQATLYERYSLESTSLEDALKYAANEFTERRPEELHIRLQVEDKAEDQELVVRQLLYWIAVESISNAIGHGQANLIDVNLTIEAGTLRLAVIDDGIGLPPNPNRKQPHGIFHLGRIARRVVGSRLTVRDYDPRGVRVDFRLPIRVR